MASDFLKERLFGLSNPQGNHGESIKEAHFHVDNTPSVGSLRMGSFRQADAVRPAFLHEISL